MFSRRSQKRQTFSASEIDPRLRKLVGVFICKSETQAPARILEDKYP